MRPLVVAGLLSAFVALPARAGPPPKTPGTDPLTTFKGQGRYETTPDPLSTVTGTANAEPSAAHEAGNADPHQSSHDDGDVSAPPPPDRPVDDPPTVDPPTPNTDSSGVSAPASKPSRDGVPSSAPRRSNRGAAPPAGGAGLPSASGAQETSAAAARGGRASTAAAKLAATLKNDAASAESMGASRAGPQAAGPQSAARSAAPSALDVSSPRGAGELLLAAGPYAQVFAANGLRGGTDSAGRAVIMRADGRPASDAEIARLNAGIRAAPGALASEPGFFQTILPEQYGAVRGAFVSHPELKKDAFKDVAESSDDAKRDLVWEKNCEKISGECNQSAEKDYKKGKTVSGADLARIWAQIRDRVGAKEEAEPAASSAPQPDASAEAEGSGDSAEQEEGSPARSLAGAREASGAAARAPDGAYSERTPESRSRLVPPPPAPDPARGRRVSAAAGLVAVSALFFLLAAKRGSRSE